MTTLPLDQLANPQFVAMYEVLLFMRPVYLLACGLVLRLNGVQAKDVATWSCRYMAKSVFGDLLTALGRRNSSRHTPP